MTVTNPIVRYWPLEVVSVLTRLVSARPKMSLHKTVGKFMLLCWIRANRSYYKQTVRQ